MSPNYLTLQQLNTYLQEMLSEVFAMPFWIVAEIAEHKQAASGHLYLELVEKSAAGDTLTAKTQAVVWHHKGAELRQKFGPDLPQLLKKGNKVLLKVLIDYHPVYGLKLIVQDLDASVTLGEMELRRRQTIEQLQNEGLSDLNAQLPLPTVLQRVAVISSPTAAGYGDFMNHLQYNPQRYAIRTTLFQSAMQGDAMQAEMSVQLRAIAHRAADFDAVVIIRGGGSKLDLATYDDYTLSALVAQMPLPVLTGIGHQQDESVIDMVAHTALKTPTAVAEFILQTLQQYEAEALWYADQMQRIAQQRLQTAQYTLRDCQMRLQYALRQTIQQHQLLIDRCADTLQRQTRSTLQQHAQNLDHLQQRVVLLDPMRWLQKGFVLLRQNNQTVTRAQDFDPYQTASILFADGEVQIDKKTNKAL